MVITSLEVKSNYPESIPNIPADSQLVWIGGGGSSLGGGLKKCVRLWQHIHHFTYSQEKYSSNLPNSTFIGRNG